MYLGGAVVQKECETYVAQNGPMQVSQTFVSSSGNLLCKRVIHAVAPQWKGGNQGEENQLYDTIYGVLVEASDRGMQQIALTPLGAGYFGFPISKSLSNIIDAISNYFYDEKETNLQRIFLTSIRTGEVREMVTLLKKYFGTSVKVTRTKLDEKLASEGTFLRKYLK